MSEETDNTPISVTLKGGKGYEAPWIVVRGHSPEEVLALLGDLGDLDRTVAEKAADFRAVNNASALTNRDASPPTSGDDQSANQNDPAPDEPKGNVTNLRTCKHGKRERVEKKTGGRGGNGWIGYFCPEKDCKPEFEDREG